MGNIIAIDPGLSNGVAVLTPARELLFAGEIETVGDGANRRLNLSVLKSLCEKFDISEAVIEDVAAMPGQGVSSMFRFGRATGSLEGGLQVVGLSLEFVRPAIWKKSIGAKAKSTEDIRALALQRWPNMADRFSRKKDHNRAEAALIGLWYVQKYTGQQSVDSG